METRKILAALGIICVGAAMRLLPHAPNFAPVGALALFSGYNLRGYKGIILPIGIMLVSDIFLGFHDTVVFVYASFIVIFLLGRILGQKKFALHGARLFGTSLVGSVLFFIITNWGVWYATDLYSRNITGLMNSYTMALPFFRNTVASDIIYNFAFFYGFIWLGTFSSKFSYRLK